ncbi:MAG: SAM domain-containing protein [Verrucomicrobiota bacterium]
MNPIELLQSLRLERHLPAFQENGIDAETLLTLTDADLKELGIAKMSDRKRILAAIKKLRIGDEGGRGSDRDDALSAEPAYRAVGPIAGKAEPRELRWFSLANAIGQENCPSITRPSFSL